MVFSDLQHGILDLSEVLYKILDIIHCIYVWKVVRNQNFSHEKSKKNSYKMIENTKSQYTPILH